MSNDDLKKKSVFNKQLPKTAKLNRTRVIRQGLPCKKTIMKK
jgi:hypothetical protein